MDDGAMFVIMDGLKKSAEVVCNILGYKYVSSRTGLYGDRGYNLITVKCVGGEKNLLDCSYSVYTPGNCYISQHVDITCSPPGKIYMFVMDNI